MNNSLNPRTDIVFLRRRLKPVRTQAAPNASPSASAPVPTQNSSPAPSLALRPATAAPRQPSVPPSVQPSVPANTQRSAQPGAQRSGGLVLGGGAPASSTSPRAQKLDAQRTKAKREDHEVQLLFPAPGISELYELNLVDRVLRLTALQSAVGTLVVSGSTAIAWESVRRVTGGQTVDGHKAGTAVMTAGNRELVGYHGRDALITLRHVRELRRAIFINRSSAAMGVRLFSGETVALPPAADGTQMVLLVHRVGNVLELRAEPVPHDWPDVQIWQEFDFAMTHRAAASAYGR